jgi:hypothetical protein
LGTIRGLALGTAFPVDESLGVDARGRIVYLGTAEFTVLLSDPFVQEQVQLLWPLRIEYLEQATIVSFIVLERDVSYLFDRETVSVRRHPEEKDVIMGVCALGYQALDLNKGVKALWTDDFMDAFKAKVKKARSTTTEAMDSERGIKANEPDLYRQMLRLPMFETMFRVGDDMDNSVKVFQINPTHGIIRMTRYTEEAGDSDEIINQILAKNI